MEGLCGLFPSMGGTGSRSGDEDGEEEEEEGGEDEYDQVATDSPPTSTVRRTRVVSHGVEEDDEEEEDDRWAQAEKRHKTATNVAPSEEEDKKKSKRRRKKRSKPVIMGAAVASAANTVATVNKLSDEGVPPPPAPPPRPPRPSATLVMLPATTTTTMATPPPRPPRPSRPTTQMPATVDSETTATAPAASSAEIAVADVAPTPGPYDAMCCGPCCGQCCGCSTTPETGCWIRMCNHRDHVRSYIGNYMIAKQEYASVVCVLLPIFLVLWAIEDTSTRSSIALSWNSHIVFSLLYGLLGLGVAVSLYQDCTTKNKSYVWAALWFLGFLASVVLFREARDHRLDADPVVFRGLRYTAWLILFILSSSAGLMHIMHLFSGKFKEISDELELLVRPGAMDTNPTCCQKVCGPKESISVYLTPMVISTPGVFITAFLLWTLTLIGIFFDNVTPVTIDNFSSTSENALKVHAIYMPLYAAFVMIMITSVIDAIVQKRFAHIWSFCFWAALGSGIAMIRHSNIHSNDNDRLPFDGLRVTGWVTLIAEAVLVLTLHAARLPTYTPIVGQVSSETPRVVAVVEGA